MVRKIREPAKVLLGLQVSGMLLHDAKAKNKPYDNQFTRVSKMTCRSCLIYWSDNRVPDYDVEELRAGVKQVKYRRENGGALWSTYNKPDAPDEKIATWYGMLFDHVMSDLGMYHNTMYNYRLWTQVYEGTDHHRKHNHYEPCGVLSFAHFLKVPKEDCFCFVASDNTEIFPCDQRENDIIFFPSWAHHKIYSLGEDEDRMIVTGNIRLAYYESEEPNSPYMIQTRFRELANDTTVYQQVFVEK